ncbi:hypothetical protein [Amycolatopsis sp. WGS_07]|uniref:hypothetical protein n=1 Tax=Amycolatopsis sp. WGS_07 TaxID=3076764 RepID=UPI003873C580
MHEGTSALRAEDLQLLRSLAREPVLPAPFGPELDLTAEARAALLPDAHSRDQMELEAGLLSAASEAFNHLHTHPEGSLTRPVPVIGASLPRRDRLQVRIVPVAVPPLLHELLPFELDGEVSGIPGVRARVHRRSTELFLLDAPDAVVELVGVGKKAWQAATAWRYAFNLKAPEGVSLADASPERLTPDESRSLASYGRAFGPVDIASGFVRRIAVLRHTLWVRAWPTGGFDLNVEWPGDEPRQAHVALQLAHPVLGLPGAEIGAPGILHIPAYCRADSGGDPDEIRRLRFRHTELPSGRSPEDSGLAAFQKGARPQWDAWRNTLTDQAG